MDRSVSGRRAWCPVICLGVDPGGSSGAAVALDTSVRPARVFDLLAWSEGSTAGQSDLRICGPAGAVSRCPVGSLQSVARWWLLGLTGSVDRASVEEPLHGSRRGASAVNLGAHAEAGEWRGLIRGVLDLPCERPAAQRWRRDVLGLGSSLEARQADKRVAALIRAIVSLPPGLPAWALKHLPDACGVALWGART